MTSIGVELSGLETLDTALAAVQEVLTAPANAQDAAQLVATIGRPAVPVDRGQLVASEHVVATGTGALLVYAAPYAVIVHASQPWMGDAISAAVPQIVELYDTRVQDAWT